MSTSAAVPNVFEAGLPAFTYGLDATPHDILDDLRRAQSEAPIAIGPLGPEILSYELAPRCCATTDSVCLRALRSRRRASPQVRCTTSS